jgi:hypothetical protein
VKALGQLAPQVVAIGIGRLVLDQFPPLDDLAGRKLATVVVRDRVDRDAMHPRAHLLGLKG